MDERYLNGSCHHLAVAMHRLTGWDLAAVVGTYRGREAVFHVFCLDPDGTAWDARGPTSVSGLVDEQAATETWAVRLEGEQSVWRLAHGPEPMLHPIHPTHVLDALGVAEELLGEEITMVSDGWKPQDAARVTAAARGDGDMPVLGRDRAIDAFAQVRRVP